MTPSRLIERTTVAAARVAFTGFIRAAHGIESTIVRLDTQIHARLCPITDRILSLREEMGPAALYEVAHPPRFTTWQDFKTWLDEHKTPTTPAPEPLSQEWMDEVDAARDRLVEQMIDRGTPVKPLSPETIQKILKYFTNDATAAEEDRLLRELREAARRKPWGPINPPPV